MISKLKSQGMKQAIWTIGEQGFSSIVVFVTGILLARATTKDDFGMYVLGLSIVMIAIGFQRAIITTPYAILFRQQDEGEQNKYRYATFIFQNIFLFINLLIFLVLIIYMFMSGLSDYTQFAMFLFILFVGQATLYFFKYTLISELDVKKNFVYCGLIYLTTIISLLSFYLFGDLNTNITYAVIGISAIVISIGFYLLFFQASLEKINAVKLKEYFSENWKLGKWLAGSNIAFIFSSQMFPWLLFYFWDKASVAELGVILSSTRILSPAIQGFGSFLLPKLTTLVYNNHKFTSIFRQIILMMIFVAVILVGVGYFFGETIIQLIYSSKYSGLGLLITLGFVSQGIFLINMPVEIALNAQKRTDIGFSSLMISVFVAFIIGLPMVWMYGTLGVMIGMISSGLIGLIYRYYKLREMLIKGQK